MSHIHRLLFLSILLLFWGAGCSRVLVSLFSPADSGAFVIEASRSGSEPVTLKWSAQDNLSPGLDFSYNVLYGYYVYQSSNSPYDGYVLIRRYYNPWAAKVWSNVKWSQNTNDGVITNTNIAADFTMPSPTNVGPTNIIFTTPSISLNPSPGVTYLRLIRYRFRVNSSTVTFSNWTTHSNESHSDITHEVYGHANSSFVIITN